MNKSDTLTRRTLLGRMAAGLTIASVGLPAARATGSRLPTLPEDDPAAKAVHYVEDASRAKEAASGANCANCSLYSSNTDSDGSCTLFKGQLVKAAGWCNSWSGL
jgi:hypothetical protein